MARLRQIGEVGDATLKHQQPRGLWMTRAKPEGRRGPRGLGCDLWLGRSGRCPVEDHRNSKPNLKNASSRKTCSFAAPSLSGAEALVNLRKQLDLHRDHAWPEAAWPISGNAQVDPGPNPKLPPGKRLRPVCRFINTLLLSAAMTPLLPKIPPLPSPHNPEIESDHPEST